MKNSPQKEQGRGDKGLTPLPSGVCCVRDVGSPRRSSRHDRTQLSLGELASTPHHWEGPHQQEALNWAPVAGAKVEEKFNLLWAGAELKPRDPLQTQPTKDIRTTGVSQNGSGSQRRAACTCAHSSGNQPSILHPGVGSLQLTSLPTPRVVTQHHWLEISQGRRRWQRAFTPGKCANTTNIFQGASVKQSPAHHCPTSASLPKHSVGFKTGAGRRSKGRERGGGNVGYSPLHALRTWQ